jgi:hypothetical protein
MAVIRAMRSIDSTSASVERTLRAMGSTARIAVHFSSSCMVSGPMHEPYVIARRSPLRQSGAWARGRST